MLEWSADSRTSSKEESFEQDSRTKGREGGMGSWKIDGRRRKSCRKSAIPRFARSFQPSAKCAKSLVVAREADRWALLPCSPDVYMTSRRSHDRARTLSFARSRLRSIHSLKIRALIRALVARCYDVNSENRAMRSSTTILCGIQ